MTESVAPRRVIPWVTIFLAVANVAVFGWELAAGADPVHPTAPWMLAHGGNLGTVTLAGEPWRLFTAMFLHYGLLHIAMNMIGLVDGGRHVERMYGKAGFLALYVVAGLAGSLASAVRGNAVSAGASGAIFGVFGAFGAFLVVHRRRLDSEQVAKQGRGLMIFLAYNVWFGMSQKGIDLIAHLGGLVAGFVCGLALEVGTDEKASTLRRSILVAVIGIAAVFGGSRVLHPKPNFLVALGDQEEAVLAKWNEAQRQLAAGEITNAQMATKIEHDILPPWRAMRRSYEKEVGDRTADDLHDYLMAREEGWEIMMRGLRANDDAVIEQGVERWKQGDLAIERMKQKK